jgi:hypothetical protein
MPRYNILTKNSNVYYTPARPGMPAYPGQPWTPAYCVTQTVTEIEAGYHEFPAGFVPIEEIQGNPPPGSAAVWEAVAVPPGGLGEGNAAGEYQQRGNAVYRISGYIVQDGWRVPSFREVTREVVTCYPEVPYIPPRPAVEFVASQTIIDKRIGWNSGAVSLAILPVNGRYEWMVPQNSMGAVVGLNDRDIGAAYPDFEHALYFNHGTARVVEVGLINPFASVSYTDDDLFAIERKFGTIRYNKNGTTFYTSNLASDGPVMMDVSFYIGDDYIYNPAIFLYEISGSEQSLRPLAGLGGDYDYSESRGELSPLTGTAADVPDGAEAYNNDMRALEGLSGDYDYSESRGVIHPLTGESSSEFLQPEYSFSECLFAPMIGVSTGSGSTISTSETEFRPLAGLSSDYPYCESRATIHPLEGYSESFEGGTEGHITENLYSVERITAPSLLIVSINSDLQAATAVEATSVAIAEFLSSLSVAGEYSTEQVASALIEEILQIVELNSRFDDPTTVWVVSEAGQSTRYEDFAFNSFAKIGEQHLGAKYDGIYALDGEDDDGFPIRASISLGAQSFGDSNKKHISNCYVVTSSDDKLYLKVTADGVEYTYKARAANTNNATQRFDIGRGLRANLITFELFNNDGCDFELSDVQAIVVDSKRRI